MQTPNELSRNSALLTAARPFVSEQLAHHIDSYRGYPEVQEDILQEGLNTMLPFVAAAERIAPYVGRTPLQEAPHISRATGNRVLLKREDLQPQVRSFKIRGAANMMLQLSETEREAGVITASAGNHAQGVASVAQQQSIEATVVMPVTTPQVKVDTVRSFGAEVVLHGGRYSDAATHAEKLRVETGKTYVHAFDNQSVIEGQGTVGLEILQDSTQATHVFVPIGGGGLAAGVASAIHGLRPEVKVIGVQYEESDAMARSIEMDDITTISDVGGFSDGTAVATVGSATFELVRDKIHEIIRVSEDDIVLAMSDFSDETRNYLEPAGALGLAGLQKYCKERDIRDQVMVAVCSGGNIAPEKIAFTIERAALLRGKRALMSVRIPERPGALRELYQSVLTGHNITEFRYARNDKKQAEILLGVSTDDATDKKGLLEKLDEHNYTYQDHSLDILAQQHASHMVGGPSKPSQALEKLRGVKETTFHVTFPERPGALASFLNTVEDSWDITRFDYGSTSSDTGSVLISFATKGKKDRRVLLNRLQQTGYEAQQVITTDLHQFMGKQVLD